MKHGIWLAAVVAATALVAAPVSAHTPSASLACESGVPVLRVDLVNYQDAHISISVDGTSVVDQDFTGQFHTSRKAGPGTVAHTALVAVTAADDPTGEQGWTRTFDLASPPCRVVLRPDPRARIAICGDPLARFLLDNSRSDSPVRFRMTWHAYPTGAFRVYTQVVAARSVDIAPLRHVLGGTRIRVTALHRVLASRVSPPAGSYGSCIDRTVRE